MGLFIFRHPLLLFFCMELFALTRRLVDIESITPNESAVGDFLCDELRRRGFDARHSENLARGRRDRRADEFRNFADRCQRVSLQYLEWHS